MLDDRPDDFFARNLFFQALLGLVSACGRLDAALVPSSPGEPAPADDPFLLFVLGLVAFRSRALGWLETASREPRPPRVSPPHDPSALEEILR